MCGLRPRVPGRSAHLQEQAAGRGEEACRWTQSRGAAPNSLSPILANLRLLPSEPRARQCGPCLDSGGRHSTDSRHFAMTSIRGSAFSEVSMTGLGERVTVGRVRAAPVSALGGGSQAARAGTAALLCSSCTRVCTHADMHTRTLRPLHTFVKIRVRPVNQHNMVAGSRAPLLFMHHFKNRCLGWVHMQGY